MDAPPLSTPPHFRQVALVGKPQAAGMRHLLEDIAQFLVNRGVTVLLERETALSTGIAAYPNFTPAELGEQCDLAIVVGGDGTMLGMARQLARFNIPMVGVNQGRLGFITDIPVSNLAEALTQLLEGAFDEGRRTLLEGEVFRDGRPIFKGLAVNDVVVSRGATAAMVELRVEIGGDFMANIRADGLIVSSPTGSTAYSLSAGGPLVHPSVHAWVLSPIAPHDLSNRPIVLPDNQHVRIEIIAGKDASVNFDSQGLASLVHGDTIQVRRSKHRVRFLHPRNWSFYATLRRKLHWNAGNQR